jgi:hypothetical protein
LYYCAFRVFIMDTARTGDGLSQGSGADEVELAGLVGAFDDLDFGEVGHTNDHAASVLSDQRSATPVRLIAESLPQYTTEFLKPRT